MTGTTFATDRSRLARSLVNHAPLAAHTPCALPDTTCLHPERKPPLLALVASGMTAAVGLHHVGQIQPGDVVLVTGAAGGTGQFAVQLAKLAGNPVVAVCGWPEKAVLLRTLGADRVIDYRSENLDQVLRDEYPKGIDLVYEGVGGSIFDTCVDHLAVLGRLLIVGYISEYQDGPQPVLAPRIYSRLLWKSASVRGFISSMYPRQMHSETLRLIDLWQQGRLQCVVDPTPFIGLDAVPAALDHLYSGRSHGKVMVQLP
jgi:NADPH-dependent curcumin reductase CurA